MCTNFFSSFSGGSESFRFREPSFAGEIFLIFFHKTDLTCTFLCFFFADSPFWTCSRNEIQKGGLDFSFLFRWIYLLDRFANLCVFPQFSVLLFVQLAAICVNFETLRNFVSVLLSTLVFFLVEILFKTELGVLFFCRLLQRAESTGLRLLAPSHDPAVKVLNPVMDDNYWQELLLLLLLIFWMFC